MTYTPGQLLYFAKAAARHDVRDRQTRLIDARIAAATDPKYLDSLLRKLDAFDKEL